MNPPTDVPTIATQTARLARAVIYLRVSTKDQANRGGASEGFSIPAQREAAIRKAQSMDAEVVAEFADRGESARSADRRELQNMLAFVVANQVDFVVVHKVDRLARNRVDDVEINVALKKAGVTLVSCTENIDETPSGMLMHGIMSSIAEFYSRNLANEVIKGSTQKAMAGGTNSKAPTGYLNVRRTENGREVRSVMIDPERGPIMRWAFEQYATGEWSLRRLLSAATERGLQSKGGPSTPSKPLSLANFNRLLKTPYYYGIVTYRGVEYEGQHEPLIERALFDQVQEVLRAHALSGEKRRKHHHYLLGSIFCKQCGSRLGVMNARNRHGVVYPYFYCSGRQERRTSCKQRTLLIDDVERRVERLWGTEDLTVAERNATVDFVGSEVEAYYRQSDGTRRLQGDRITRLDVLGRQVVDSRLMGGRPPRAWCRRWWL